MLLERRKFNYIESKLYSKEDSNIHHISNETMTVLTKNLKRF